jgi:hypothetical protein
VADDPKVTRPEHLTDSDEQEMLTRLDKMLSRAKAEKAKVAGTENEIWLTLWDFYIGGENHWKGYPGVLTGYQRHTYNRIGRNIEIAEALLDEMHSSAEVQPVEPTDEVSAALLDVGKDVIAAREYNQRALSLASRYARIIGTGIVKVWWDASLHDGLGDVRWQMWPSDDWWMDPGSLDIEFARYVITETRMDRAEAESKWGVKDVEGAPPKQSELGERVETGGSSERETTNTIATDGSDAGGTTYLMPGSAFFTPKDADREVVVREHWIRDDVERWPNGRHIITVGKKIVLDENQEYSHGKWPFAIMVDQVDPKSVYGDTTSRQAIEMQRELNLMLSLFSLGTHLNVAAPWIRYPQGGITAGMLQKQAVKATAVLTCRHPAFKPERLSPGAIQPRLMDAIQMLIENIDKAMRVQDVIPPGARGFPSSGEVVRELRETQLVEIRQKAANKAHCIKRVVELTVSLMQQFYATDRWVRIVGPLPQALEGKVDVEGKQGVMPANGAGDAFWVKMNPDNMRHGWDVKIVESTGDVLSRQAQADRILKLAEADQFNTITVGDVFELEQFGPYADGVKRKIRQRQKDQAAMAAQQAQAGPPGGAPPPGGPPQQGVM